MTEQLAFGPEEEITIGELAVGDFVVKVPAQERIRGLIVNSAVRTISDASGWVIRSRGQRGGTPIDGKSVTFEAARDRARSWPSSFSVIVRRRVS